MIVGLDSSETPGGALLVTALAFGAAMLADGICSIWAVRNEFWAGLIPGMYYIGVLSLAANFPMRYGLGAAGLAALGHGLACLRTRPVWADAVVFFMVALAGSWFAHPKHTPTKVRGLGETGRVAPRQRPPVPLRNVLPDPKHASGVLLHQIRTPLASIEGAAFILQDAELTEGRRKEFVAIVLQECRRLRALLMSMDTGQVRPGRSQEGEK